MPDATTLSPLSLPDALPIFHHPSERHMPRKYQPRPCGLLHGEGCANPPSHLRSTHRQTPHEEPDDHQRCLKPERFPLREEPGLTPHRPTAVTERWTDITHLGALGIGFLFSSRCPMPPRSPRFPYPTLSRSSTTPRSVTCRGSISHDPAASY